MLQMAGESAEMRFLKDRSEKCFLEVYSRYNDDLYRMALVFSQYRQVDAEDIVQDTWVVAVKNIDTFKGTSSFKTWLTGILINKSREKFRANKKHDYVDELPEHVAPENDTLLAVDLANAMTQLSPGYREILTLHDMMGFNHREIGTMLGINKGTSKSQLFRARQIMRQLLK